MRGPSIYPVTLKSGAKAWEVITDGPRRPDGRRTQYRRRFRTQVEAKRDLVRLRHEVDTGAITDARNITLAAYLTAEWLPAVNRVSRRGTPLAPTTRQRYTQAVSHAVATIGDVKMGALRPVHIERLRDSMLARGLAPQTVGDNLRVLGQALRKATAKGLISRNPADAAVVDRPSGAPKPLPIITPAVGQAILAAVRGTDPWDVAAHLALGCTLRREEVLGLTWPVVDLEAGRLEVRQAVTWAEGTMHIGEPKSHAGARIIELPGFVADALRRHRAAQAERRLTAGAAWEPGDWVVDRGDGSPWAPPVFSKGWARFAERHGFEGITFHGLRHGAATLLLAAGVPDPVAVRMMGHADTRILQDGLGAGQEGGLNRGLVLALGQPA